MRALGQVYYHSTVEKWAPGIDETFDPLSLVIEKAKRYGIRVHAWINVFYVWAGDTRPDSSHILIKQHEAVLCKDNFPTYAELKKAGTEGFYLDPASNKVKKHILAIVGELINNYNLDGIHYDYFRYPGIGYSFTPASRTKFRMQNFFDPYLIYNAGLFHEPGLYNVFKHADSLYRSYLNRELTDFLGWTNQMIKEKNPDLSLSIAVKPDPIVAKHRYFQDWTEWIKKGVCDFVVVMNYRTDWQEFVNILSVIKAFEVSDKVIVGISTFNQNEQAVRKRILYVRKEAFNGFSLFSFNHMVKNKSYLYKLLL